MGCDRFIQVRPPAGEMAEWLKELAWKACIPQGIQGSNPCLSAIPRCDFRSHLDAGRRSPLPLVPHLQHQAGGEGRSRDAVYPASDRFLNFIDPVAPDFAAPSCGPYERKPLVHDGAVCSCGRTLSAVVWLHIPHFRGRSAAPGTCVARLDAPNGVFVERAIPCPTYRLSGVTL
jgi:hypothetical protein